MPKSKQKKSKKSSNRRRRRTVARMPRAQRDRILRSHPGYYANLSECEARYVLARLDPFNPEAVGACIPGTNAPPTMKFVTTGKFSATAAAGEYLCIADQLSAANNMPSFVTNSLATPQIGDIDGTGAVTHFLTGSPFVGSNFGNDLTPRVVGYQMRVTDTSAPLTTSGVATAYYLPNGGVLSSTLTPSDVQGFANSITQSRSTIQKKPLLLTYDRTNPYDAQEFSVRANGYLHNPGLHPGVVFLDPGTEQTSVLIEVVVHWEIRGSQVATLASPNIPGPSFPQTASAVSDTLRQAFGSAYSASELVRDAAGNLLQAGVNASRLYSMYQHLSGGGNSVARIRYQQARMRLEL